MIKSAPGMMKHGVCAVALLAAALSAVAEEYFPAPVFVPLRDADQVARYPGPEIWQGGPKMLYNAISPDEKTLVVSSPAEGSVYIFDVGSGRRLGRIECGKDAKGVKISPDGREAYVANEGAATVSVVDLQTLANIATIPVEKMPHNIRFRSDGSVAYVTLQGGAGLGVIDIRQRRMTEVLPTPGIDTPHNLDLSKDETRVFIRDTDGKVGVLELASGEMLKLIDVGRGHAGIDVTPDGRYAITGAIADELITVIDTETLAVVKQIKVGFGPHGVRASRDNRWWYVAVTADDQLTVIDSRTFAVAKTFPVAGFPFWVALKGNP